MKQGPIKEPKNVDLFLEGRTMTAADRKRLAAFIEANRKAAYKQRKVIEKLQAAFEKAAPWSEALAVHELRDSPDSKFMRPVAISRGSAIIDIDESGIGGSPTEAESKEITALIRKLNPHKAAVKAIKQAEKRRTAQRTSRQTKKRYPEVGHATTLAKEPEPPRWTKARPKTKRTKA